MKSLILAAALLATLLCSGCKTLGYNPQSLNNQLTPSTGETTYVRTWQTDPKTGQTVPIVQEVPNK